MKYCKKCGVLYTTDVCPKCGIIESDSASQEVGAEESPTKVRHAWIWFLIGIPAMIGLIYLIILLLSSVQ